jgi:hypothetical protein
MHPQPRVQNKKAHEQVTTGSPETIRPSLRNGFNGLFRALPGEPGFVATIPSATPKRCRRVNASVGASGPHVLIFAFRRTPLNYKPSMNQAFIVYPVHGRSAHVVKN